MAAASLRSGSGPPLSYASVTAGRGGRMGQGTGRGPVPRTTNKTKPASVSAPGAKKNRTALAVANLFASLADVTGAPTGRPVSPLPEAGSDTAVEETMHSPKAKRRRVRKQKTGKAGLKTRFPPVPAAPGAAQDQDPGAEASGHNTSSPA